MTQMTTAQAAQQNNRAGDGRYATKVYAESSAATLVDSPFGPVATDSLGVAIATAGVDNFYSCPALSGRRCDEHGTDAEPHVGDMELRACIDDGEETTSNVPEYEAQFWTMYSMDSDHLWMAVEDYDSRDEARAALAVSTPAAIEATSNSYVEALVWSSTIIDADGEVVEADGFEPSEALRDASREEVAEFLSCNAELIARARQVDPSYTLEQAGHDFALTRHGHGAGFWDRGLGEVGEDLTAEAKAYGSVDLYVGDDGMLHVS